MPHLPTRLAAATVLVLTVTAGGGLTDAAAADPGTCGVRSSGPDWIPGGYSYTARNSCSSPYYFRVRVQGVARFCQYVPAKASRLWEIRDPGFDYDTGWTVELC